MAVVRPAGGDIGVVLVVPRVVSTTPGLTRLRRAGELVVVVTRVAHVDIVGAHMKNLGPPTDRRNLGSSRVRDFYF